MSNLKILINQGIKDVILMLISMITLGSIDFFLFGTDNKTALYFFIAVGVCVNVYILNRSHKITDPIIHESVVKLFKKIGIEEK